jgi:hypothetical protein
MKSDMEIKEEEDEIRWDPDIGLGDLTCMDIVARLFFKRH